MSDHDALIEEMLSISDDDGMLTPEAAATLAFAHINSARAEERERCAAICESYHRYGAALMIRASTPAPAAPVVWTDEERELLLCIARVVSSQFPHVTHNQEVVFMRAALEAASGEDAP